MIFKRGRSIFPFPLFNFIIIRTPEEEIESETGKTKVEIVAVATLESGKSVACKPITIKFE